MMNNSYINKEIEIGDKISGEITEKRIQLGFTIKEIAGYLYQNWKMSSIRSAEEYIRYYIEGGLSHLNNARSWQVVPSRQETTAYEMHEIRISDYLAALGNTEKEIKDLFWKIKKIQPKFKLLSSKIKPLKKNDRARI